MPNKADAAARYPSGRPDGQLGCNCVVCVWKRQCPIFEQLVHETVRRQGWGPSFAIVGVNVRALWSNK